MGSLGCASRRSSTTLPIRVCLWFPDGQRLITASVDEEIVVWNTLGQSLATFEDLVFDIVITPDGSRMVSIRPERKLQMYHLDFKDVGMRFHSCVNQKVTHEMPLTMTSVTISNDPRYLII